MRRVPRALTAAALATGLLLTGCGDSKPSSPTPAQLGAIDFTPTETITVDEAGFSPATLEIDAGDVIRLVNKGAEPHSFTADERFDSGRLQPGDDTILVLSDTGRVPYRDLDAPAHRGTITVRPAVADQ